MNESHLNTMEGTVAVGLHGTMHTVKIYPEAVDATINSHIFLAMKTLLSVDATTTFKSNEFREIFVNVGDPGTKRMSPKCNLACSIKTMKNNILKWWCACASSH